MTHHRILLVPSPRSTGSTTTSRDFAELLRAFCAHVAGARSETAAGG